MGTKTFTNEIGRICTKCKEFKSWDLFFVDRLQSSGRHPTCKTCNKKQSTKWANNNKDKRKHYIRKNKYGITKEEYFNLMLKHEHKCAICGLREESTPKGLVIDHCHSSNKIRGILCDRCNVGLGCFYDDMLKLKNAIKYLETHDTKNTSN